MGMAQRDFVSIQGISPVLSSLSPGGGVAVGTVVLVGRSPFLIQLLAINTINTRYDVLCFIINITNILLQY